jgi:hypothetical protein
MPKDQRCVDCKRYGVDCEGADLEDSFADGLPCFVIDQDRRREVDPERKAEELAERERRYWENRHPVTGEELW